MKRYNCLSNQIQKYRSLIFKRVYSLTPSLSLSAQGAQQTSREITKLSFSFAALLPCGVNLIN